MLRIIDSKLISTRDEEAAHRALLAVDTLNLLETTSGPSDIYLKHTIEEHSSSQGEITPVLFDDDEGIGVRVYAKLRIPRSDEWQRVGIETSAQIERYLRDHVLNPNVVADYILVLGIECGIRPQIILVAAFVVAL